MANDWTRRGGGNARDNAENAFKAVTAKPKEPAPQKAVVPGAREAVTLRIDSDVLEHFQGQGPGWQERINAALRAAAGL